MKIDSAPAYFCITEEFRHENKKETEKHWQNIISTNAQQELHKRGIPSAYTNIEKKRAYLFFVLIIISLALFLTLTKMTIFIVPFNIMEF